MGMDGHLIVLLSLCGREESPGLTLARQTMVNFLERAIRLYEQEPGEDLVPVRLGARCRNFKAKDDSRRSLPLLSGHRLDRGQASEHAPAPEETAFLV